MDFNRRENRCKKIRKKIFKSGNYRLTVYKSLKHIYCQLYSKDFSRVLASSSSLGIEFNKKFKNYTKKEKSIEVGIEIAKKVKGKGIVKVAVDCSGFKYHGCIKNVIEQVRLNGIVC